MYRKRIRQGVTAMHQAGDHVVVPENWSRSPPAHQRARGQRGLTNDIDRLRPARRQEPTSTGSGPPPIEFAMVFARPRQRGAPRFQPVKPEPPQPKARRPRWVEYAEGVSS
jgi:hypothetical protein